MTPERIITDEMVETGLAKLEISLSDEAREKLRSMLCPKCGGADGGVPARDRKMGEDK